MIPSRALVIFLTSSFVNKSSPEVPPHRSCTPITLLILLVCRINVFECWTRKPGGIATLSSNFRLNVFAVCVLSIYELDRRIPPNIEESSGTQGRKSLGQLTFSQTPPLKVLVRREGYRKLGDLTSYPIAANVVILPGKR